MLALTADQGLRLWHAYGSAMRGWVLTAQGDIEEGIDEIRTGLDRLQGFGAQHFQPYFLCLLAEAHLDNGQPNTSLEILDRAHGMIEATEERFWEPEAWRLRGEIFASARVRKAAEAERHFLEAIDIARRQQARSLELRAAISLSRLLMQQGRRPEAHAILKPIHNWFTEGLSTFDLIAASTVLKQLI
jgi:predicted ATPase